jgi:hypothetical protein
MSWGKGWEVGLNREAWAQRKALDQAARILATEHGERHQPGDRIDLCPVCQQEQLKEQAK